MITNGLSTALIFLLFYDYYKVINSKTAANVLLFFELCKKKSKNPSNPSNLWEISKKIAHTLSRTCDFSLNDNR